MRDYLRFPAVFFLVSAFVGIPSHAAERSPLETQKLREVAGVDYEIRRTPTGDLLVRWMGLSGEWVRAVLESRTKTDVVVFADVSMAEDQRGALTTYSYAVQNRAASKQRLQSFVVEALVPVLVGDAPIGWQANSQHALGVSWTPRPRSSSRIDPGGRLSGLKLLAYRFPGSLTIADRFAPSRPLGFVAHSGALPGLVRCWAEGEAEMFSVPEEMPEEVQRALPRILENAVTGYTIGPIPRPERLVSPEFVTRIVEYFDVGKRHGWVEGGEGAEAIQNGLAMAEANAQRGTWDQTVRALQLVRAEVSAQLKSGEITPEIDALVGLNIDEFLLEAVKTR